MSITAVSSLTQPITSPPISTSTKTSWQAYLKVRQADIQELSDALKAGDLAQARAAYNNLLALGQKDIGKDNPFLRADRALDFNAIGGALQRGDLDGARQALTTLQDSFNHGSPTVNPPSSALSPAAVVTLSGGGT